jgi:chaperone required for assembly of F1-ATPase
MKRFYKEVSVAPAEGGFAVLLDGKPIRTPAKAVLAVPTRDLADAVATEWRGQDADILPHTMPLTKFANTAIDRVRTRRGDTIDELVKYAGADLLCYRTDDPVELRVRQDLEWDPWLDWLSRSHGADLVVTSEIIAVEQPEAALLAVRAALEPRDEFALAGLHTATTITGSLVLALALADGHLTALQAFEIAVLDERYQAEKWGVDDEAERRARALEKELESAAKFIALARA